MYFVALATDYDGTLAEDGRVSAATIAALDRLKASGRRLILVTGRELPDLKAVFPELDRFDMAVAENGSTPLPARHQRGEADRPGTTGRSCRGARGVRCPVGRGIAATWEPNEAKVLDAIRELGLEWQIIFNKGAVMDCRPASTRRAGCRRR